MQTRRYRTYAGGLLVLLLCWGSGCAKAPSPPEGTGKRLLSPHRFDKTAVDLETGRPESASRYHQPRGAHLYIYDETEVDLATPLPAPTTKAPPPRQATPRPSPTVPQPDR